MKDLYTFDLTQKQALQTYREVQHAYAAIFGELKLDYVVAEASSGNIGGKLSHEYQICTANGEDTLMSCTSCSYHANDEVAVSRTSAILDAEGSLHNDHSSSLKPLVESEDPALVPRHLHHALDCRTHLSADRTTEYRVFFPRWIQTGSALPRSAHLNHHRLRSLIAGAATTSSTASTSKLSTTESTLRTLGKSASHEKPDHLEMSLQGELPRSASAPAQDNPVKAIFDERIPANVILECVGFLERSGVRAVQLDGEQPIVADLLMAEEGDGCPRCHEGTLKSYRTTELGHTFHLGTKYSERLGAHVTLDNQNVKSIQSSAKVPLDAKDHPKDSAIEMGCHGIGISRMIAGVADVLADERGLNWPRAMAPFEVVVIPGRGNDQAALNVYDHLMQHSRAHQISSTTQDQSPLLSDIILDDRTKELPWKLNDADLIGYCIIVVVGRAWQRGRCEVQCRRLQYRQEIPLERLPEVVRGLLDKL